MARKLTLLGHWLTRKLLVACRNLHADVLEWLWFVNSHPEVIYKLMYGDKDTFRLAFALAGKSNFFEQVRCSPADQPPICPSAC